MAEHLYKSFDIEWGELDQTCDQEVVAAWSLATAQDADVEIQISWGAACFLDSSNILPWQLSTAQDADVEIPISWGAACFLDSLINLQWMSALQKDLSVILPWQQTICADPDIACLWGGTVYQDQFYDLSWVARIPTRDILTNIPWGRAIYQDLFSVLPWQRTTQLDVSSFTPYQPGIGDVYYENLFTDRNLPWLAALGVIMIDQDVTLIRVSDSEPVNILSCDIGIDAGSWAWSFSGQLPDRTAAALVRPEAAGPVEVQLTINEYVWRFIIESVSEDYKYGIGTYNITGRSPSAVLAAPYAKKITKTWDTLTSSHAIASNELTGTGWSENWDILDWNVPANVFSVTDKTTMEIISLVAKAAGGIIQTHPNLMTLNFSPLYPASPKNWATEAIAETIMQGVILSQSIAWEPKPGYNYVVVSGQDDGVLVHVRRTGTAYDTPAPTIMEPLILTEAVAQERGRNKLDATGYNQSRYNLTMPLPHASSGDRPKLLFPGDLIEVQDLFETWRGQVASTKISTVPGKITMSLGVERHYI